MKDKAMSNDSILILNVDDNDGARYVKTRILQGAGFKVVEAANGTDGLAMARQMLPALVLLDVKLPDINGIEVCRRIKDDPLTAGVLVLQTSAALTGRDDKIRGLEGGADNYLAAPIEADELVANVNALLRLQRTQTELRNSEERFRQLTENIEDVFWMFDLQSRALLYVNNAYDSFWGRAAAQLQHNTGDWLNAIHADDRIAVSARWEALRRGEHYDEEYRLLLADGTLRWVRDRAFQVRDAGHTPYRIARISSDITQRKTMEGLLRAADDNKNDFLATLAHELRNPLSPIRNAVALMGVADASEVEVHRKARQVIMRQVGHLARLVDDLLDVARISEGKLALRLEDLELRSVLEPALETARPLMESRGHTLTVVAPPHPIRLHGDPVRLAQAVGNLLHNAAKFTVVGGAIRLEVTSPAPDRVRIAVRDNGIGISTENLPRIFDMFAQGASAHDRAHDGLGIGLSLVSKMVQMHGGTVYAESAGTDQGSSFVIELPVLAAPGAEPAAPAPAGGGVPVVTGLNRLLVVDDNVDSGEVLGDLLKLLGYEVRLAHDAASAMASARAFEPHAMILDIGMPHVDGYALARMLRADSALSRIRLIAHTGFGSAQDREKTAAAGFDFHLVKPAALDELQQTLRLL
ncbi:PAS domain S-box-containing protein [Duganella sp. 1411]|uniref:response regulator n=1 Tax=Duganella sp. 1411 TaxID=2806572 RepID=UPI001B5A959F|nr:response regulator [Duganella sp. 1411]MBP1207302.1 PAS domain S-box-containing protein [Duganella sp. 1411]